MTDAVSALLAPDGAPLRADARRNAERLVAAARTALAERGVDVTTRDIAERAGVGLGTLYRRVPSLDALLAALLLETIEEMIELADRAKQAEDPWRGFVEFAEPYVRLRASSCGLNAALSGATRPDVRQSIQRLSAAVRELVEHVREAGAIRTDLDWQDVAFALASATPADHTLDLTARPDQWRRNLAITLDGLRTRRGNDLA
jgi:AcrR family transcriptional regulator